MRKKLTALATAAVITAMAVIIPSVATSADTSNASARKMETLDRGLVAVKATSGVYLSWRLLGTENLSNQAFDIYRDGTKIHTTGVHDATCYTDTSGTASNSYVVVPAGESIDGETAAVPWTTNTAYTNGGFSNSIAYKDISFNAPADGTTPAGDTYTYGYYSYTDENGKTASRVGINDMSTGDLDGDGEYELVVKWDPSNSQDNANSGYTGNVYLDGYEIGSDSSSSYMWRIDLGVNIRAGAHYTQFLVYDFDGDGKSEIVCKTAPGSKDGKGNYVSAAGNTDTIKNADNSADYRTSSGTVLSGEEWLTIFDGETGAALQTVDYDPPRSIKEHTSSSWGDSYGNRCERYLAGVAYLDGVHPSIIMTRGYYTYAYAAAYTWDGTNLTQQWLSSNSPTGTASDAGCVVKYADGSTKQDKNKTLYGQGAHSLSVADVDNDGKDEIIFGSAILDHDGTVLLYDGRGHGDAEHVSDFDNDGQQEIFMVHEAGKGNSDVIDFAVDIKRYDGDVMLQSATGDIGRGVMANIDDDYAVSSGNLAAFWSTADGTNLYNQKGEVIGNIPNSNNNLFENFFIYWDGDLGREMLDGTMLGKQDIDTNSTTRIYYDRNNSALPGVASNNGSKKNPGLVADILGDWREEIVYPLSDGTGIRIYFSTIPTTYRLTTLMHDSQYRCAIAWQNVGYNQPPHTSYYIGSAALAKDGSTTLNYLAPAVSFTTVDCVALPDSTPKPTIEVTPAPEPTAAPILTSVYENDCSTADNWAGNSCTSSDGVVSLTGTGTGNRSHLFTFPSEVSGIKSGKIRLSFDFYFSDNVGKADRSVAQIALVDNDNTDSSGKNDVASSAMWSLTSTMWSDNRNDIYYASDATENTFTVNKTTWYTITADIDYDNKTADVTVTNKDTDTEICSSSNVSITNAGLKGIFVLSPRYDSGIRTTQIDNIAVYTVTEPITETAAPTATPTAIPTAKPTATPVPTGTPTATPTEAPDNQKFTITAPNVDHASVKLTDLETNESAVGTLSAAAGHKIRIECVCDEGYVGAAACDIVTAGGDKLQEDVVSYGVYEFTMPSSDVNITVYTLDVGDDPIAPAPTDAPTNTDAPEGTPAPTEYSVEYTDGGAKVASPNAGTYCVIFAAYKNGAAQSIKIESVTFEKADIQTVNIPNGFDTTSCDTVKVFLWNDIKNMTPLCKFAQKDL